MLAHELIEVLCAAHLASRVESPFEERGGLIIVGPPGGLKSTFLETLDGHYPDALSMTDLNAKALAALRDRIANGTIRTLVFPELAKLYERKAESAANLEGALRAIAAEGFKSAAFEEQSMNRIRARACVIGAITPATQQANFARWEESGWNRRFLWSLIRLDDPTVLDQAVIEWQRIKFQHRHVPQLATFTETIPNHTTREERARIRMLVKYQPGGAPAQQMQLLTKILAVLRWWYQKIEDPTDPMDVIESFGESLGREGATITLHPPSASTLRRYRHRARAKQLQQAGQTLSRAALAKRKGKR